MHSITEQKAHAEWLLELLFLFLKELDQGASFFDARGGERGRCSTESACLLSTYFGASVCSLHLWSLIHKTRPVVHSAVRETAAQEAACSVLCFLDKQTISDASAPSRSKMHLSIMST